MAQDINQLIAQINELRQRYTDLTARPAALFNVGNIEEANRAVNTLQRAVADVEREQARLDSGFGGIYETIKGIVSELKKTSAPINLATSAFRKLQSSAEKLKLDQQGLNKLTRKQLEDEQKKQKIYQQTIREQATQIMRDNSLLSLSGGMLENSLRRRVQAELMTEEEAAMVRAAKEGFTIFEETNVLLAEAVRNREKEEKALRRSLGISAALLGAIGKIPFLGESAAEAYEKIKKEAEETYEATSKYPGAFKNFGKAITETGKILIEKIKDPVVFIGSALSVLISGFNKFDQAVVGVQKRLALSREEATKLVQEFTTFNSLLSSADLLKSVGAIQDKLGSVGKVSRDTAETFGRLNTLVGLSEEGAAGLASQADAFGKKASDAYTTSVKTTAQISKQYKTTIDQRAVLESVGKASSYTLVQFRGSTQALTEGVAKAKALGISLETVSKSASGLLNFQQSIEDELAAELLTGKQLNLEQARYYALTNQQSKLMDELNGQIGTYSDFTAQTVLAQEAQAKALGMSVEDLSDMLFKQEYMKNTAQEQVLTEAEAIKQRIETLTLQEKLQKATEKLSDTFANFVTGPLGTFLTDIKTISAIIGFMIGSQLGKLAASFGPVISAAASYLGITTATAAATTATATAVSFGAMLPVILGGVGAILAALYATQADDLFSAGGSGSGYGKRTLIAPEGAFALNDRDNIIATTNPVNPARPTSAGSNNITVAPAILPPVYTRIELNGSAIGNATSKENYGVGKNIYAFGGRVDYSA